MHSSLPQLNQRVPVPTCSIQEKCFSAVKRTDTSEHTSMNECTDHPKWEHRVFTLCTYAWRLHVFTCMWCMHAGYVCVVVCVAFCLYYIRHLLLSFCVCMCVWVCVCACVSGIVRPTLQMIELLSKSASACYLLMFMICCANSVNASTWWLLLSHIWTYLIQRHLSTKKKMIVLGLL